MTHHHHDHPSDDAIERLRGLRRRGLGRFGRDPFGADPLGPDAAGRPARDPFDDADDTGPYDVPPSDATDLEDERPVRRGPAWGAFPGVPMGHGGPHGHRGGRGFGPGFGPGGPGFGPDGLAGPGFGPGGPRGRGRGPRARGDIRAAILLLLDEQPRHGYELMQEITERSSGAWSPSPGSIYPTLQALEDEGLVSFERVEGRKTASLTPAGEAHLAEHRERLGDPFATTGTGHGPALAVREEFVALKDAVRQVARVGTPAQHTAAAAALVAARKELYRLLAEGAQDQ